MLFTLSKTFTIKTFLSPGTSHAVHFFSLFVQFHMNQSLTNPLKICRDTVIDPEYIFHKFISRLVNIAIVLTSTCIPTICGFSKFPNPFSRRTLTLHSIELGLLSHPSSISQIPNQSLLQCNECNEVIELYYFPLVYPQIGFVVTKRSRKLKQFELSLQS